MYSPWASSSEDALKDNPVLNKSELYRVHISNRYFFETAVTYLNPKIFITEMIIKNPGSAFESNQQRNILIDFQNIDIKQYKKFSDKGTEKKC